MSPPTQFWDLYTKPIIFTRLHPDIWLLSAFNYSKDRLVFCGYNIAVDITLHY